MTRLSILYIGNFGFGRGSTSWHRMDALCALGHSVEALDVHTYMSRKVSGLLITRLIRRLFGNDLDLGLLNLRAKIAISENRYDIIWLDKVIVIKPALLESFRRRFPNSKIVGYSPDDCMNPGNQSSRFIGTLPFYDIYFTTKSYNCADLSEMGCARVEFIENAYHRQLHRPLDLTEKDRVLYGGKVVFIGHWEEERSHSIETLARCGVEVRVWGDGWENWTGRFDNVKVEYRSLFGEEYVKVLNASDICLCFLRKENRDLQTTRSIEIPACGAFMLAERTAEHLDLFVEGKEAEYFSSNEELVEKAVFYLENPKRRKEIAKAGRARCVRSGYSNEERLELFLKSCIHES